jgi:hypothetical protein
MFWRRLIKIWLYLAMVLLSAGPASAASSAQAKPHQGSAELSVALHIWLEASASAEVHTGNVCLSGADTSDVPHAARGATEVASSAAQGAKLARQLAAEEIAGGHAFAKHAGQFPGVSTPGQFAKVIEGVMENATQVRSLSGGRTAFWQDGVVVIRNPGAVDGGTAFVPTNGLQYFQGLR